MSEEKKITAYMKWIKQDPFINNIMMEESKRAVEEAYKEHNKYLLGLVDKHCSWWQKIYMRLAIKFPFLDPWFVNIIYKNGRYGVEINGKYYWKD